MVGGLYCVLWAKKAEQAIASKEEATLPVQATQVQTRLFSHGPILIVNNSLCVVCFLLPNQLEREELPVADLCALYKETNLCVSGVIYGIVIYVVKCSLKNLMTNLVATETAWKGSVQYKHITSTVSEEHSI